ncbi:MAG: hypothetical protein PHS46_00565 [Candidatus Omnitrophica bacterium]|nr:hypothetical protein [Candidatus Omnitrophota bacterium]
MLWQEALCANPELLETHAGTPALQAPTTFQDLNINSYENTLEALLKYFTLAVPDIRSFKLRITPKIRNSSLEFNFEKMRIEDNGTIFVPCSITTDRSFMQYDAVINTAAKSIRIQGHLKSKETQGALVYHSTKARESRRNGIHAIKKTNVLVLCSHNMERSPLVARLLSINTPEDLEGKLDITSGSIYKLPDANYAWEYRSRDRVLSGHTPYRATREDLKSADLVFVMTNDHIKDLLKKYPELDLKNKTFLLLGNEELRLDTDGDYPEPDSLYMHSKMPYQALRKKITSKENLDKIFAQIRSVAAKRHESFAGGGSPVASIRNMVEDIYLENKKQRRRMTLTEYCNAVRRMIPIQDDGSIASVYLDGYSDIESCVKAYLLDIIRPPKVIIDVTESQSPIYSPDGRIDNIRTIGATKRLIRWRITTKRAKFLVIEMLAKQLGKDPVELIATDYKITRIAELGGRKIFSLLRWAKKEFNTANLKEAVLALNKHLGIDKRPKAIEDWTRTISLLAPGHPATAMYLPGTIGAIMSEKLSNDEIDALALDTKGGECVAPNLASEKILTQLAEIELGDASKSFRRKFKLSIEEVCEIIPYKSVLKTCVKKFRRASSAHNNATFKTYLYYSLKLVIRTAATHSEKWNKERQAPDFVFDDNQYKKYMDADKDDDKHGEVPDKNALISLLQRETGCSKRDAEIFYDRDITGLSVVRCGLNNGITKQRISTIVMEVWEGIADNPYIRPMFAKNDKLRKEIEKADERNQQKKEILAIKDALDITWETYDIAAGNKGKGLLTNNPASNLIKARALYRANAPKRLRDICIALDIEISELGAMIGIKPSDIEKIRSCKDVYIDYNAMMAANNIYQKRAREILRSLRGTPTNAEFWKLISPTHPLSRTQIRGILRKQYIPLWVIVRARESAGGTATHANAIEKPFVSPQITDDPLEDLPAEGLSRGLRGTRPAFMKTPKERLKRLGKAQQAKPVEYISPQVKPIHEEPSMQTVPETSASINSSQSGLGQEDALRLRDLTKPDETIKNFFETVISILLSGKKLKLIFEDGIGSSQWSRVLAIITKLQTLMADKNWPLARLLKNLEVKIVPAEKIPYLLRDMDRDENTEVFVFARQSKRQMFINMSENRSIHVPNPEDTAHAVYIDETDFHGRARYPLMEIITLTIVKHHNNYSVEEVVESLNNEGITLDKLNLADIINKDGDGKEVPYLLFKLLPRAKELETQELLKTNGLYKEFMAAA